VTTIETSLDISSLDSPIDTADETSAGFTFFVDVSTPGEVDFTALKAGGCKAVLFQTGDGLGEEFANDVPARLAPQARDAGLHIGFYHYNRPRRLGEGRVAEEAQWMKELVDRAGGLRPGIDLRVVMDVESTKDPDLAVDIAEFIRQLRDELRELFGHEPLLYSGWEYAKAHLASIDSDIWVAWFPEGDGSFNMAQNRWHEVVDGQAELGQLRPLAWQYAGDVKNGIPGVARCDASIAPADEFANMLIPAFQPHRLPRPSVPPLGTITAANGRTVLTMQDDGNLVVYRDGVAVFDTKTQGRGRSASMQEDGNLVVYGSSAALWDSKTSGHPGARLEVQDDGNVVIYDGGDALWSTQTSFPPPPPPEAPVDLDWALARINEWNFRSGVASFQEAFTEWDLVLDGDLGSKTAEAVKHLVDAGGKLSEHFHLDEFRCKHCGRARVNRELVRALERMRVDLGPLSSISSYRCEDHPIEAVKPTPGQHAFGTAWDPDPYLPRSATVDKGFSGRGHTKADPNIVSHLDVRHAGPANVTASSPQQLIDFEDN
jgi:GH25 family lysozyme M1 (1,4-beta-N-acetylmuramidase)